MNEPKQQATWSTILLSVAFLVALILIAAPLGTRFGLWPWGVGLRSLLAVAIGGSAVAIVAVITFFVARKPGGAANRRRAAMAFVVAVLPAAFMWVQILYARTLPMIHDISTDTTNPPVFTSAHVLGAERMNTLQYGPAGIADKQRDAYPDVQPIQTSTSPEETFDKAVGTARALGWEVVSEDRENAQIEAIDTTFWFGFKDDIAIRITSQETGSRVDLRSISRVGLSDVGANAKRIVTFIERFGD